MRILVFGASGMLGHKLIQRLGTHAEVWGTLRSDFAQIERYGFLDARQAIENVDVFDDASVRRALEVASPDVVINAAGIVKQLRTSKDVIQTLTVNSIFPHKLAEWSGRLGFRLISISTDCVFDGARGKYSESDTPNAVDLYGKSKHLGEVTGENCLTLRTSIIGRELNTGHSLIEWFLSNEGNTVKGYSRAIYSGFPTVVLADLIRSLIFDFPELSGLYHVSSDPINKYDLLMLVKKHFGVNVEIVPDPEFEIDRSLDSSTFRARTGFVPESWDRMIEDMASDPTPYNKWKTLTI